MATLVLGAVGGLIGGPIGAALGAAIGNRIDQRILAPKGRRGPRLNELSVQSSTYGSAIPKIFGTMRVSGTVIWSTDLIESRTKQGNGKGRPKTTVFSYSASFAVALSARPIARVGRIWADGKLLRGEAGDFKTETGFRLHMGSGDQTADPLIAAVEGAGAAPAYRGIAYAVFEDFQLGDYGNRIPSLAFEVIADDGHVTVGRIVTDLSPQVDADIGASIGGYAAEGDSVRGALEVLAGVIPMTIVDDGAAIVLTDMAAAPIAIADRDLGSRSDDSRVERIMIGQRSAAQVPETLSIAYYDQARDYLPATQTARRDGGARRSDRVDLPATLDSDRARRLCEAQLSRIWSERLMARIVLPSRGFSILPGAVLTLADQPGRWRVQSTAFERQVMQIDLVRQSAGTIMAPADAGRHVGEADVVHGPTTLVAIDVPPLGDAAAVTPQILVAAAGISPGWRRAALSISKDSGQSWVAAGATAAPAVIGTALGALGNGAAAIFDMANSIDVALLNPAMDLNDADQAALLRGENLALLGNEAIQFGRAIPLGAAQWRLSQLLRGRRGTEHAMLGHIAGEPFVLLDPESLAPVTGNIGDTLSIMAVGIADLAAVIGTIPVTGNALRPLSPCHLRAKPLINGDTRISWVRRSRNGWSWPDGVDAPLGEESEVYDLELAPSIGAVRQHQSRDATYLYTAAERSSDASAGAESITITVRQSGQFARSLPASLQISL